jgi:hypothetical protein
MNIQCPNCRALHWVEERLARSSKRNPNFGVCCLKGVVELPTLREPPVELCNLLRGRDRQAKTFRENIRCYNSAFAMTSVGVEQDMQINNGQGPYVYRIHGALYHRIGSLLPPDGQDPVYAQLYLHDGNDALQRRMNNHNDLDRDVMRMLQDMLYQSNHFVGVYKQAYEVFNTMPAVQDRIVHLHLDPQTDGRRYNLPTADEVAVIVPGDGSKPTSGRDIILREHTGALMRISECHPAYCPLHYVLMFPFGELGWHYHIPVNRPEGARRSKLTMREYYTYRLFTRTGEVDTIFRMGKLFQQFVVDAWAATEQDRLRYLHFNQTKLHTELYWGLRDATTGGDHDLQNVGQLIILPSTFTSGSRYMRKLYQDSMAIVRALGSPDLFITMTANPNWPEVAAAMLEDSDEKTRADIVARVFNQKVKHLLKLLNDDCIFGQTVAHVYTIEFQKRGLPHVHLLIFMARNAKPRTPEHVDSFISAELPDKEREPELFALVS